jgi:hypothetical protein
VNVPTVFVLDIVMLAGLTVHCPYEVIVIVPDGVYTSEQPENAGEPKLTVALVATAPPSLVVLVTVDVPWYEQGNPATVPPAVHCTLHVEVLVSHTLPSGQFPFPGHPHMQVSVFRTRPLGQELMASPSTVYLVFAVPMPRFDVDVNVTVAVPPFLQPAT